LHSHEEREERAGDRETRDEDAEHVGAPRVGEAREDRHRPEGGGRDRDECEA
jgi:hypothetical protein